MFKRKNIVQNEEGATAVEFVFILPVLLFISFGIIEFIVIFSEYHKANEATRIIARNLSRSAPLVSETVLTNDTTHTCTSTTCSGVGAIIADAQAILPHLTTDDVEISYEVTDLGNIGYSVGYKPLIVVKLTDLSYEFVILSAFPGIPDSVTINTAETTILGKWY